MIVKFFLIIRFVFVLESMKIIFNIIFGDFNFFIRINLKVEYKKAFQLIRKQFGSKQTFKVNIISIDRWH